MTKESALSVGAPPPQVWNNCGHLVADAISRFDRESQLKVLEALASDEARSIRGVIIALTHDKLLHATHADWITNESLLKLRVQTTALVSLLEEMNQQAQLFLKREHPAQQPTE